MPTYYTYRDEVPLKSGQVVDFTSGRGYYAAYPASPPATSTNHPPTVAYNPDAYVPGGSSTAVAVAIETQGLTHPGPTPVQVPYVVLTNLEQDTGTIITVPKPAPSTPAPSSGPPPHHGTLTLLQLYQLWVLQGGDEADASLAAHIAICESSGETDRIHNTAYKNKPGYSPPRPGNSPEYSVGLWQVNLVAHPSYTEDEMLDAYENASAIIAISGNGSHFAETNVDCYKASVGLPLGPVTPPPTVTPVSPVQETKASTSFHSCMTWLASDVPARGKTLQALGDTVPVAVRSVLWPPST